MDALPSGPKGLEIAACFVGRFPGQLYPPSQKTMGLPVGLNTCITHLSRHLAVSLYQFLIPADGGDIKGKRWETMRWSGGAGWGTPGMVLP
jgi:hypothetical protein